MRQLALAIGFFALLVLSRPYSGDQDKQDPVPAKSADKKDAKKEASDDEKPKKTEPKRETEDKLVYGQILTGKLRRLDANSARDFTVGFSETDPAKVAKLQQWQLSEMNRISRASPQNRAKEMAQYQLQLARKQSTETTTMKDRDFRAADNCKVRSNFPPIEYDDRGQVKRLTQKELNARRGKSKLPGYPIEFGELVPGQTVEIYLAKTKDQSKKQAADKSDKKDADDKPRPEVVMIVVTQEAPK